MGYLLQDFLLALTWNLRKIAQRGFEQFSSCPADQHDTDAALAWPS